MMTKQQYVDYWVETSENDWVTVEALFAAKRYFHCLFWNKVKEIRQCLLNKLQ